MITILILLQMSKPLSQRITWTNLNIFDPKVYFAAYHFWEPYDPKKDYSTDEFTTNFGKGIHTYEYSLYKLHDIQNSEDKSVEFIVAEEILSDNEKKQLESYCQCQYHTSYWFNPAKYFICKCCVGCVASEFPQQYVINASRQKMKDRPKSDKLSFFSI
jgi:hypothetical protein